MLRKQDFDPTVALPPGLDVAQIRKAIEFVEREASDLVEIYFEQANVFSAIIGILGTKAMDQVSCYEEHRNIDTAQQRFPDLKRRGSGAIPTPNNSLESKGSRTSLGNSIALRSSRLVYRVEILGRHHEDDPVRQVRDHLES